MNTYLPVLGSPPLASPVPASAPGVADAAAAGSYTDVNALEGLKRNANSPAAMAALAGQVEALFLQMMLKSMRDASPGDSLDDGQMSMYQDLFDKQVALTISQHNGLGFANMLKRQLSNRAGANAPAAAPPPTYIPGSTLIPAPQSIKATAPKLTPVEGKAGAAHTSGTAAIVATPAQFVAQVLPSIRRTAAALGVHPLGLLAQAALETGWGQRMPRNADGSPSLNLFGVKAGADWTGARAPATTVEFSGGVATRQRTAFRAYGSIEEGVGDFAKLLATSPRYRDALAAGANPQAYVERIGRSGYATDPEYANKLSQVLNGDTLRAALGPRLAAL